MNDDPSKDFPIVCESCLGDNPHMRMTKEPYGAACKICDRPFTVYTWRPGKGARMKKTEVCQTCAKMKNVCQSCVLDLKFGLPVQLRDKMLAQAGEGTLSVPTSDIGVRFAAEKAEHDAAKDGTLTAYRKINRKMEEALLNKLRNKAPSYDRSQPHVCSFFIKGTCMRGDSCPYRHEKPQDNAFGNRVDVRHARANKEKSTKRSGPRNPVNENMRTLWVGGVDSKITDGDLRSVFQTYGAIESVRLVYPKYCAFISFMKHDSAKKAVNALRQVKTEVKGSTLNVNWGRSTDESVATSATPLDVVTTTASRESINNPDANAYLAVPTTRKTHNKGIAPPPGVKGKQPYYASMDPNNAASL